MLLFAAVLVVSILSGATAAVAGFGIGSLLTPVLAASLGTPLAIAAVALPHAAATSLRCWRLRREIDRGVLARFGIVSAAGSLAGALLAAPLGARALTLVLGALLVLTGISALVGPARAAVPSAPVSLALGALSGLFGGLAGNQGGVRAVALLRFGLPPRAFVATATASALLVDAARTPVYLARAGGALLPLWPLIGLATAGCLIGTILGERILLGMSPERFRRVVGTIIGAIGVLILARA